MSCEILEFQTMFLKHIFLSIFGFLLGRINCHIVKCTIENMIKEL